ncbi:MAG: zinc ribbon domain-containing protein [Lachnospiraceae bacterium]|nr:zinc ribbon domain-containing protein [Lachnospiraceae bacterium]
MEVKCEYCGSMIPATADKCPNCGGTNENMQRSVNGTPKTIAELQNWYRAMNLPPENVTRFFIGKNINEPRAFGIYEQEGEFIVYKNKDDGSRAVRYRGRDEAYAVNELYLKLKAEILNQKSNNIARNSSRPAPKKKSNLWVIVWAVFAMTGLMVSCFDNLQHKNDGYYSDGSGVYYNYGSDWYAYDSNYGDYIYVDSPWFVDNKEDYNVEDSAYEYTSYDFKDSTAWDDIQASESYSNDSDYSWDSGSDWDSGGSDWGSDW